MTTNNNNESTSHPFATGSGIAAGESLGSYTTHGDALRRTPYGGFRWLAGAGASRLLTKGLLLSSEMVLAFLLDLRFFFPGVEVRRGLAAHFSFFFLAYLCLLTLRTLVYFCR